MTQDEGWRPTASFDVLRLRAQMLRQLRAFFDARGVMEVETPALSRAGATDRHLASFRIDDAHGSRYLHTSPEYPMKRLLAAGSGDIWQACKVFRAGEAGRFHNPEFTLIEWYRTGFDHHRLMREVAELIANLVPSLSGEPEYLTYGDAFQRYAGVDPHSVDPQACRAVLQAAGRDLPAVTELNNDDWLDLVAGEIVYPALGQQAITFVYDFPASQAALARIRRDEPPVAERFEAFVRGVELANGFHELADPGEQRRRFERDMERRRSDGLPMVPMDEQLLQALGQGFPDCAGVALGFDRLVMLAAGAQTIDEVIAFPFGRA